MTTTHYAASACNAMASWYQMWDHADATYWVTLGRDGWYSYGLGVMDDFGNLVKVK
ncbi:hypothetical protein ABE485_02605 [Achromobacter spanius]|uniref:hypothetical protein n=1 Tax=Achromobacter spanius TaxID=217203 RepID=UPI00320979F7